MKEKLKDIPGYEGRYAVTTDGRVWSHVREIWMRPWSDKLGYSRVDCRVRVSGKRVGKSPFVHRLVAKTYLENTGNKPHINHKNCNPSDNRLQNLEWCTHDENIKYAASLGRMARMRGQKNGHSKISNKTARQIKELVDSESKSQMEIAKTFGVSQPTVSAIKVGRNWGWM